MGIFSVNIDVASVHGESFEEIETIVDTANDYTTLPREMLERLGVPVNGTTTSEFTDGSQADSDTGWARIRLEDDEIYARVIFGEEEEAVLLGAIALETARLAVDLNGQRLIRVPARRY